VIRELRLPVASLADAAVARALVVRFALDIGLSRRAASEVAIAASELVTNIVKYAGTGELLIGEEPGGVLITALDRGPGLPNSAELFEDGVSRGSLREPDRPIASGRGTGGGTLWRLCDEVELGDRPGGGAIVRVRKLRREGGA
jgi:anti-sigma regulatory factor (Ser/Thr protein kinase)